MIRIRRGFTLPEVCVALTVFSVGTTGLLACWNFFNREVADERLLLERYDRVASTMESLVAEVPIPLPLIWALRSSSSMN